MASLQEEMLSYTWWHTIDLGSGLITPGVKKAELMREEFSNTFDRLDFVGKSVLDIGAWNGAFSIEAMRCGARSVLALDRPVDKKVPGGPDDLERSVNAKKSREFAIRATGLDIQICERDMEQPDALAGLGQFDIVLFLGVFYHLVDPISALRQIYSVVNETLVLESYAEATADPRPLMVFFPGEELARDASNWWGPNVACLEALLRMVGFRRIETIYPTDRNRVVFRAHK